jgi:hypothetical protein
VETRARENERASGAKHTTSLCATCDGQAAPTLLAPATDDQMRRQQEDQGTVRPSGSKSLQKATTFSSSDVPTCDMPFILSSLSSPRRKLRDDGAQGNLAWKTPYPMAKTKAQAQVLLSKLTKDKVDRIFERFKSEIDMSEGVIAVEAVVDVIFDKAFGEPESMDLYAQLCQKFCTESDFFSSKFVTVEGSEREGGFFWVGGKGQARRGLTNLADKHGTVIPFKTEGGALAEGQKQTHFKLVLLNKCRRVFEDGERRAKLKESIRALETDATMNLKVKKAKLFEAKELRKKIKKRAIGVILFIGRLFKRRLLTEYPMHECISTLMRGDDRKDIMKGMSDEETVVALCKLFETLGSTFEELCNQKIETRQRLNKYFEILQTVARSDTSSLPKKVKMMMLDLVGLRENNWVKSSPTSCSKVEKACEDKDERGLSTSAAVPEVLPYFTRLLKVVIAVFKHKYPENLQFSVKANNFVHDYTHEVISRVLAKAVDINLAERAKANQDEQGKFVERKDFPPAGMSDLVIARTCKLVQVPVAAARANMSVSKQEELNKIFKQRILGFEETLVATFFEQILMSDSSKVDLHSLSETKDAVTLVGKACLTFHDIEAAVRATFSGELEKKALKNATKAVKKLHESGKVSFKNWPEWGGITGLKFDVPLAAYIASRVHDGAILSPSAGVYLAAIAEYMLTEIWDLSGKCAYYAEDWMRDDLNDPALFNAFDLCILPQHVKQAIKQDAELFNFFDDTVIKKWFEDEAVLRAKQKKKDKKRKKKERRKQKERDEDEELINCLQKDIVSTMEKARLLEIFDSDDPLVLHLKNEERKVAVTISIFRSKAISDRDFVDKMRASKWEMIRLFELLTGVGTGEKMSKYQDLEKKTVKDLSDAERAARRAIILKDLQRARDKKCIEESQKSGVAESREANPPSLAASHDHGEEADLPSVEEEKKKYASQGLAPSHDHGEEAGLPSVVEEKILPSVVEEKKKYTSQELREIRKSMNFSLCKRKFIVENIQFDIVQQEDVPTPDSRKIVDRIPRSELFTRQDSGEIARPACWNMPPKTEYEMAVQESLTAIFPLAESIDWELFHDVNTIWNDTAVYNALIEEEMYAKNVVEARSYFREMQSLCIPMNLNTFENMMRAEAYVAHDVQSCQRLFAQMAEANVYPNTNVFNMMIDMEGNVARDILTARALFYEEMNLLKVEKDTITFEKMIEAEAMVGKNVENCRSLFFEMERLNLFPNRSIFCHMIYVEGNVGKDIQRARMHFIEMEDLNMNQTRESLESFMKFEDQVVKCRVCAEDFVWSKAQKAFHAAKGFENVPAHCMSCKERIRAAKTDELIRCRICQKSFLYTAGEQLFFAKKGYDKPSKCKQCRKILDANRDTQSNREDSIHAKSWRSMRARSDHISVPGITS